MPREKERESEEGERGIRISNDCPVARKPIVWSVLSNSPRAHFPYNCWALLVTEFSPLVIFVPICMDFTAIQAKSLRKIFGRCPHFAVCEGNCVEQRNSAEEKRSALRDTYLWGRVERF